MMKRKVELRVFCGAGDGRTDSGFRIYTVEADEKTTILDALEKLRVQGSGEAGKTGGGCGKEGGPVYRHSCHHGSCGTCACLVNGVERLACTTRFLDLDENVVTLEPLRSAKRLIDLAVYPDSLFQGLPDTAYLRESESNSGMVRFEDCIECGSCLSACPVRPPFLGPAALAAFEREISNRPERKADILKSIGGKNGAAGCQRNIFCSLVCPTKVAPAKKIMTLKTLLGQHGHPTPGAGKQ